MKGFAASVVGVSELPEANCLVVVLADDADEPTRTFEVQVALEHEEQDRVLGQDTYSLTVDGAATVYGGVESCRLLGSRLELELTPAAAASLGLDTSLEFDLDLGRPEVGDLRSDLGSALRRIFDPARPQAPILRLE